jgi:hypothetical protein
MEQQMSKSSAEILSTIKSLKDLLHRWHNLYPRFVEDYHAVDRLRAENEAVIKDIQEIRSHSESEPDASEGCIRLEERLLHLRQEIRGVEERVGEYDRVRADIQGYAHSVATFAENESIDSGPLLMLTDNLLQQDPQRFEAAWEVIRRAEIRAGLRGSDVQHDPNAEARDAWLYRQAKKKNPPTWKALAAQLKREADKHGWRKLATAQAVQQAVARYIERHSLPPLPLRKES